MARDPRFTIIEPLDLKPASPDSYHAANQWTSFRDQIANLHIGYGSSTLSH